MLLLNRSKLTPGKMLIVALNMMACSDIIEDRAKASSQEFGIPKAYSIDQLLADPEIDVVLNDCDKKSALRVKDRLEQALDDYLTRQNLAKKIELRFGCAAYPDEAKNDKELIRKARRR